MLILFVISVAISSAQSAMPGADPVLPGIPAVSVPDSVPSSLPENEPESVYDIYWVTHSLKSGWKTTDTALVGTGVEPCDTIHPFIMPVNGKFWRGCTHYHSGWDIGMAHGSPVMAGLSGKVRYTRYCSGYGKLVIIRHYSGLEVYYAHLSKILVDTNQWVEAGDTIGLVGATGRARGSHLHMEFRVCDRALDIADYYTQNDTLVNLYKVFDYSKKQSNPLTAEYHTVIRGDNLWDISQKYGTTVSNLCSLNRISKTSTLRIGQKIKVR